MTDHKPLPVAGYTAQSEDNVALDNEGKVLEERYLRWLDKLAAHRTAVPSDIGVDGTVDVHSFDPRFIALARTHIQTGAMFAVRSIFQPTRIKLPEDDHGA